MKLLVVDARWDGRSTIGEVLALTDDGTVLVHLACDWRETVNIHGRLGAEGPFEADFAEWQVLDVHEAPKDGLG